MTRFFIDDEDTRLVKQMKDAGDLMDDVIKELCLRTMYPDEDEVMRHIQSAINDLATAKCIFFAQNVADYDEWIKENDVQVKKDET